MKGLLRNATAPASNARWRMPGWRLAVTMITGVCLLSRMDFSCAATSQPSIFGINMSRTTPSYRIFFSFSIASWPPDAVSTSNPSARRTFARVARCVVDPQPAKASLPPRTHVVRPRDLPHSTDVNFLEHAIACAVLGRTVRRGQRPADPPAVAGYAGTTGTGPRSMITPGLRQCRVRHRARHPPCGADSAPKAAWQGPRRRHTRTLGPPRHPSPWRRAR